MLSVKITKKIIEPSRTAAGSGGFTLDVEFQSPPGVTILFGASGSGKSMTLKSVAGIIRPDSGRIANDEQVLFDSDSGIDLPIRQRGVGYVFQNLALFPHLSVRDNIKFGMSRVARREREQRALKMMAAFSIEHTAHRKPREISGGEAQRVALARALSSEPRILLLDEPLSALDEAIKIGIIDDLKRINHELRLPIIYVTHSREEAITLGERVIVYEAGRIAAQGEPLEVFAMPKTASIARLTGAENIFNGQVVGKNDSGGTMTVEISDGSGRARIEAPNGNQSIGALVRIAVPSGDILLATEEFRSTSARNILRGQITAIEDKGARVRVRVESGVSWNASLTRQAVMELSLAEGKNVWLAIKTHSCYLLDE